MKKNTFSIHDLSVDGQNKGLIISPKEAKKLKGGIIILDDQII